MTLAAGTRLGPYEVIAPIGAGGMGEVYRERDERLKRDVAIKVLPASISTDPDRLHRFKQEAQAAGVLNHPNVIAVYDIGTNPSDDAPYVVQELLEGETLRAALSGGRLSPRKSLDYSLQIVNGLAAAHEKGIVHRDLKPENVFVTNDGRVKILDFGLAKLTHPEEGAEQSSLPTETAWTEPGVVLGTLGYMSPEQVKGKPADSRSDIFSFGAILYEMLSGQRAFRGESAAETMSAILNEDPPELSARIPDVSSGLERIVRHCLEKNSAQRFQSARDLGFDLDAMSDIRAAVTQAPRIRSGRQRFWAAILAAIAAGLVFGYGIRRLAETGAAYRNVTFHQKTFQPQPIFAARFAPDGRTIVFSAAARGNSPELYSIRDDYPEPRPLGLPETHLLAISSQNELAVLTRARWLNHRVFIGTLARMPLGGGAPREILENVRDADWSPDGSSLAVIREVNGRDRLEFPIGKTLYEASGYVSDLRISPKGDRVGFFEHPVKWDDRGSVAVVDRAGRRRVLTEGYSSEAGLAWSPDGEKLLFSAGTTFGNLKIYAVTTSGAKRIALESAGALKLQDVAPNGRWLVTRDDSRRRILVGMPSQKSERDLSWLDYSIFPVLSGDGRLLLFTDIGELGGRYYTVCVRGTDGSPVVRLGEGWGADLSPDGAWVLAVVATSPQQLRLYPTGPGDSRALDRGNLESYDFCGSWFRDGQKVLVCGHEPGQASRCYVQQIKGGVPRPVTPEGTTGGFVSPDGQFALAKATSGGRYALYPLSGGTPRSLPLLTTDDIVIRWTPDGRSLWIRRRAADRAPIEQFDLETGRRELIADVAPRDTTGVIGIMRVSLADDPNIYAYDCWEFFSRLFVVEGLS